MSVERYKPVQRRLDHAPAGFIVKGAGVYTTAAVIAQDGSRSEPLLSKTLMARKSADAKFTPFINEAAADGTAIPVMIYMGPDIAAADLVAGDIANVVGLLSDAWFDEEQLVIENSKSLNQVIVIDNDHRTIRERLRSMGLVPVLTQSISNPENP